MENLHKKLKIIDGTIDFDQFTKDIEKRKDMLKELHI